MRWSRYSARSNSRSAKSSSGCSRPGWRSGRSAGSALLALALLSWVAPSARAANEITVEPSTIRIDGTATVTVKLEGSFASVDNVNLPMRGLAVDAGPSVSSQFSWINGQTSRSKTFSWQVHPQQPGRIRIGPLRLVDDDGNQTILRAVILNVLRGPPPMSPGQSGSLLDLLQQGRGVAIVPEVSPRDVYVGQQIDATWYLYAVGVQGIRVTSGPKLDGFWSEDLEVQRGEGDMVNIGGNAVRRIPIRRMALYPTRDGKLVIGPLEATVQVVQRSQDPFDMFGFFGQRAVDVQRSSPALEVEVKPLPQQYTNVGTFKMTCSPARVPKDGPVSFVATVEGKGNLRAASTPAWDGKPPADQEVEELGTKILRKSEGIVMRRSWRFLLFPAHAGTMTLPPLGFSFFDPVAGNPDRVQCPASDIQIPHKITRPSGPSAPGTPVAPPFSRPTSQKLWLAIWIGGGIALVVILGAWIWGRSTRHRRDPAWKSLVVVSREPRKVRDRLRALVESRGLRWSELMEEAGDRGDAFRAFVGVVDLMEKEPWEVESLQRDFRSRLKELLAALAME